MTKRNEQAFAIRPDGTIVRRWYLFESDGHKVVNWAEDEAASLEKAQRAGRFGPDATLENVRIEPAPWVAMVTS